MIVYALRDPRTNEVRYVGKSFRTARRRLRRHLAPCYLTGNTHKERWIRSILRLGMEPKIEVIQVCTTPEELACAERAHIGRLRANGARLTNATAGGDGGAGPHTAESKEKIRRALTGKRKSAAHRRNSGLAQRGRQTSDATRAKLRTAHSTRPRAPLSESHRLNMSVAKGGRPFVDHHGNRYDTQKGAARLLGLNVGHLNSVLHGTRRHVQGLVFRFIEQEQSHLRVREFPQRERE